MGSFMATQDWFLESLVNIANETEVGVDVTLMVGGTVVTGTLASGKQYFEGLAGLKFQGNQEIGDVLKQVFADAGQALQPAGDEPPQYVHLRDARVVTTAGTLPTNEGMWWRGHLSEVDAFWVGSLGLENGP
jgi:hypothetical protein